MSTKSFHATIDEQLQAAKDWVKEHGYTPPILAQNHGLTLTVEIFDTAKAYEAFARMGLNRSIVESNLHNLMADISPDHGHSKYLLTGEPIIFDNKDALRDGQHRLMGVLLTGVSITSVVVRGISQRAANYIDRGRARGLAHMFEMMGKAHSKLHAATVTRLYQYKTSTSFIPSASEAEALDRRHPELSEVVAGVIGSPVVPGSILAATRVMGGMVASAKHANDFVEVVKTGHAKLGKHDPAFRLREHLTFKKNRDGITPDYIFRASRMAWNRFNAGGTYKTFVVPDKVIIDGLSASNI